MVDHKWLSLPNDDYDSFTVRATGSIDHGVVFALIDNVNVTGEPVPEPAALSVLALGFLAALRRRKQS